MSATATQPRLPANIRDESSTPREHFPPPANDPLLSIKVRHYDPRIADYGIVRVRSLWWNHRNNSGYQWFLITSGKKSYMVRPRDGCMLRPIYAHVDTLRYYQEHFGFQKGRPLDGSSGVRYLVDHHNGDSLLNDPYNGQLKCATSSENAANRPKQVRKKPTGSQYKGISVAKQRRKDGSRTFKIDFQYKNDAGDTIKIRKPSFTCEKKAVEFYNTCVRQYTNGFGRENTWTGFTPDPLEQQPAQKKQKTGGE